MAVMMRVKFGNYMDTTTGPSVIDHGDSGIVVGSFGKHDHAYLIVKDDQDGELREILLESVLANEWVNVEV